VNSLLLPFVMQLLWVLWGGVSVLRRGAQKSVRGSRRVAMPVLAATLVATSACSPCAGVDRCSTAPRFDLTGTIVDARTGKPAPNVRLTASLPNGASATSITNADGRWRLTADNVPVKLDGTTILVVAPGTVGYTVRDLVVTPRTIAGDAQDVGRWTSKATARYQSTLIFRGKPLDGAVVSFLPDSGSGATDIGGKGVSNGSGIFQLQFEGRSVGPLPGTLHVEHPPDVITTDVRGFALPLDYHYALPLAIGTIQVGGQVSYGGNLFFRGNDLPAGGVPLQFIRRGGVATLSDVASATTAADGFFRIDLVPTAAGEVIGEFVIKPPGQPETHIPNVHLGVYDSTSIRYLGRVEYGDRWQWSFELFDGALVKKGANVAVRFRQTAGVPITPSVFTGRTDANARFEMRATVQDTGIVTGDLTVMPDGRAPHTFSNVRLRTNPDDSLHFAGVFSYGQQWAWSIELWTHDMLKPAPNVDVEFRQTQGVAITPSIIRTRTGGDGRFELRSAVTDSGIVQGDIVVMPVGQPQRVIPDVKLPTFTGNVLRFGGIYGYGPALRYVGEVLLADGTPVVGAQVEWTQISGITATPALLRVNTDAQGRFPLTLIPSTDGEVVGIVRVTPPPPWTVGRVFTFTNLRLSTFENGNLVLAVTHRIPPP
jgi:5-hydroxyisourate hydrolase-like protein (transthyretin family)